MYKHMLFKIRFLRKGFVASHILTRIWLLPRMDSQMIKEIVPFSESHRAIFIFALKYVYFSLGGWVQVFEDFEISCIWETLLYSYL